jgi:para-nitrobenzyl esterase
MTIDWRCGLAIVLLMVVPMTAWAQLPALDNHVRVSQGEVVGAARGSDGVLAFKGIPYAAAPVGALRWRAPVYPPAWGEPRDASRYGARCLSAWRGDPEPGPPRSEDCLNLNVWTTARQAGEGRPVMVWVHGGGFQFGSSANPTTDGSRLAAKGVVVVSFNYRLGVLGFLAHPDLDREGPSGDYGLQDQLAALRWVKANIARFGGDPKNVTVFGESAGAHSIGILMASPLSKGLFQKAIGESGAWWDGANGPMESFSEAHARGVAFVQKVGGGSIAALRSMEAAKINADAGWDFTKDPMVTAFSPNVDRYVVPDLPAARFTRGEQMHIPLLAGWNGTEDFPFHAFDLPHATARQFREAAAHRFGQANLAEFLKLYPADTDGEAALSANALDADLVIAEQVGQWLTLQAKTGEPVYGYNFTYTSPYVPIASHLTEVPFVFGTLTPEFIVGAHAPPAESDRKLSDPMMSYWVDFATRGDPNGPGLHSWPRFGTRDIVLNLKSDVAPMANPKAAKFRFLAKFRTGGVLPATWRDAP